MANPPNLTYAQVPTAGQWNLFFSQKQDALGFTPLNQAGGTMTGKLRLSGSTALSAPLNIAPGTSPTSPNDGDIWTTTTGLFARVAGATIGPISNGDVSGPNVSVTNNIATFADTTGATIKDSSVAISSLMGPATVATLTNKTFDTAGTGNSLKINGTAITAVSGTGSVVLATSPTLTTPNIGTASGAGLTLSGLTASSAVATNGSKALVSVTNTGTGNNVLSASPTLTGTPVAPTATAASYSTQIATTAYVDSAILQNHASAQGRLTLVSGTPVPNTNVIGATTLYFTPFNGNECWVLVSGVWTAVTFAEISISLSTVSSGLPYDVFCYSNAGTLTLEILAWTNDTTRATALSLSDGIFVKSGDPTRRYLGSIYGSSAGTCDDSLARRLLWNMYNRVQRPMQVIESTDSWTYTTDTWRQANGSTANRLDFFRGMDVDNVVAQAVAASANSTAAVRVNTGIGLDSTTAFTGFSCSSPSQPSSAIITTQASYIGYPGLGRHLLNWLERSAPTGTTTWYGDNGNSAIWQFGISGTVFA